MTLTCITTAEALTKWLIAARKTSKSLCEVLEPLGEPLPEDEQELRAFFLQYMAPGSYVEITSGMGLSGWSWMVTISWEKDEDDRFVVIDLPGIPRAIDNLIKQGHSINVPE